MKPVHYIEGQRDLSLLCRDLARQASLALDTEFMRKRTYYAKPCLLQIASRDQVFLLDLIKLSDCKEVCRVLADNKIDKIMHGCEQDLEVLNQVCGWAIEPVFDTQLAAAFLAYGYQIGYNSLVAKRLAIEMKSDQTRSDWARRPLSGEQRDYAANDVIHLLPLWDSLTAELKQSDKYRWFLEENHHRVRQWRDKNEWLQRPLGSETALSFMENARQWRESEARRVNLPRQWVVSDACLAAINKRQAGGEEMILQLEDCRRLSDHYARALARMKGRGASGGSGMPRNIKKWRLSEQEMDCLRKITQAIKELAQRHGMDEKLIAKSKTLARCVQQRSCSAWHKGWRKEAVSVSELQQINNWLTEL